MYRRLPLIPLLLRLLILFLVAGDGVSTLHRQDVALYRVAIGQKDLPVRLLFPGEEPRTVKVLTPRVRYEYPTIPYTMWEADVADPSPKLQELATILHCLASYHAVSQVVLSSPLSWSDAQNNTVHLMLNNSMSSLKHLFVGVHGNNSVQAEPIPPFLRTCAIPQNCLSGDPSALPTTNASYPFQLPPSDISVPCPDFTEDELLSADDASSHALSLPLLMRRNGEVFPTLPLCVAMHQLGLKSDDIRVQFGKSLRLGNRVLPLDFHGRTPLGNAQVQSVPLRTVLQPPPSDASPAVCNSIAVVYRPMHPMVDESRGSCLAATISCLMAKNCTTYLPGTRREQAVFLTLSPIQHSWYYLVIVWSLTLVALLLLKSFSLRFRLLLAPFGISAIFFLAYFSYLSNYWISISTWLLCWLLIISFPNIRRKKRKNVFYRRK